MMHQPLLLPTILLGFCVDWVLGSSASVQYGAPSQCDDFQVSWNGGTPPFSLLLIPLEGTPRNMTIPASSYNGSYGSYSVQLPFPQGATMMAMMYDAMGVLSGSVSPSVVEVGQSTSDQNCNTTDPHPYFYYSWPDGQSPVQCSPFQFSQYPNATLPVTLMVVAPGADPEFVHPSVSATSFNWTVDRLGGTSVVFVMTDAQGHQGGASQLEVIQPSNNYSCVVHPTSATSTPATSSPSTGNHSNGGQFELSAKAIAGIAAGGAVSAIAIAAAAFFLWRRCRRQRPKPRVDLLDLKEQPMSRMGYHTPQEYHHISPFTAIPTADADFDPYAQQSSLKRRDYSSSHMLQPSTPSTFSSTSRLAESSSSVLIPSSSARVVVHQDYADALPPEEEVVELPPAYREDRRPIPGLEPAAPTRPRKGR